MKILTVDDSKTIRMIVAKALRPFDCQVLEADNGVVGLAVAGREKPDLILLDYTMPVMDGFEVLARLRSDADLKNTPVIMLTAEAGRDTVIKIAKLGVRDYLIKPFKEELLLERIRRVLDVHKRSETSPHPRRFDDPINLLVLDDKPAIVAQIRAALADTCWQVGAASQPAEAVDLCAKGKFDVVIVSLSLAGEGAFAFFQNLRGLAVTSGIPVFGMAVRTAAAEQSRAQQAGFAGLLAKPIDPAEVKSKIARALKLETSYKYYQQKDSAMLLTLPKDPSAAVLGEISCQLQDQLTLTADAGSDKLVIDLTRLEKVTLPVVELIVSATHLCQGLSLKLAAVGSPAVRADCKSYEETQSCTFAPDFAEAIQMLGGR